jgi:hypothetical protein
LLKAAGICEQGLAKNPTCLRTHPRKFENDKEIQTLAMQLNYDRPTKTKSIVAAKNSMRARDG